MSFDLLQLIPSSPEYVPDTDSQQRAQEFFAFLVPNADEVTLKVSDAIQFFDAGTNWKRTLCPICQNEISVEWWQQAMESADLSGFRNLESKLPCCGSTLSLNELHYEWPQGFSRFALVAKNPKVEDITQSDLHALERVLQCSLRLIWSHY